MKKTNEVTALVKKVEQLETEICFEIVELEDELLSSVTGGLVKAPPTNGTQCSCSNGIAC